MIPPTPTALPPGVSIVSLPSDYGLWAGSPSAIQTWNLLGTNAQVIQVIFLIALVVIGMAVVMRFIKQFTRKDMEE